MSVNSVATLLRAALEEHLKDTITSQLNQTYANKDGHTVKGRNMNELMVDLRNAGYSMPGTTQGARDYFLQLGFGIASNYRKTTSGARFGDVVLPLGSESIAAQAPAPREPAQVENQVWEREREQNIQPVPDAVKPEPEQPQVIEPKAEEKAKPASKPRPRRVRQTA